MSESGIVLIVVFMVVFILIAGFVEYKRRNRSMYKIIKSTRKSYQHRPQCDHDDWD